MLSYFINLLLLSNVIVYGFAKKSDPHEFMWGNWNHHRNLNIHVPNSGHCKSEATYDSCIMFAACGWNPRTSSCFFKADGDYVNDEEKDIFSSSLKNDKDSNNILDNERRRTDLTFPKDGCESITNQGLCIYYSGCVWFRNIGCFPVKTQKPTSRSPTKAPTKKDFPDDGSCSNIRTKTECNLYGKCIWDFVSFANPFCRKVKAGEEGGGDTPTRAPSQKPTRGMATNRPTTLKPTLKPISPPVNRPTTLKPTPKPNNPPTSKPVGGTSKPTKGGATSKPTKVERNCEFPAAGCASIKKDPTGCNIYEGCIWSTNKKACVIQSGCEATQPPQTTHQPTIPKQDRVKISDMCKVPSGGCRNARLADCEKYNGCYVLNSVCTERECDSFDCGIRRLAFDFAVSALPRCQGKVSPNLGMDDCISELKDVHDGLELESRCGFKFNEGEHQSDGGSKVPNIPLKKIYVSTKTGNDAAGDGTFGNPYKTIHHAVLSSREFRGTDRAVIIRAGTYYITETIVLNQDDSKLTIAPYENEKVIISGAVPLKGIEWKTFKNRILVADVSSYSNQLKHLSSIFFDDVPATRARHPNADPWTQGLFTKVTGHFESAEEWIPAFSSGPSSVVTKQDIRPKNSRYGKFSLGYGGNSNIFTPPASYWAVRNPVAGGGCMFELPRGVTLRAGHFIGIPTIFQTPSDAYVHAYHVYHWGNWVFRVGSQKDRTFLFQSGGFQEARGSCGIGGTQFYIENMLELLDARNEFYLDTRAMKLYYFPNSTTSNPDEIPEAYATTTRRLFHISGNSDDPVKNIVISGLRFEKTYTTTMDPHEVPSAGDWSITRNAAIFIEGAENVEIHGNSFYYMGGNGVFISNYARNVKVTSNRFKYLGASAVLVVGDHRFYTSNPWEMLDPNHPFDTVVDGNIMSEIGNVVKQSAGFFQALARGSIVQNNVIFNSERAAVNFNDGYGGDNKIFSNLMFNTARSTWDHGPFNTWDRQPYIQSHPGSNFQLTGEPMKSYVKGNYLIGGYGGIKGIDHDDGSTWWENSENLLVYTYQKLKGREEDSHHNIVLFPYEYAVFLSEPIGIPTSNLKWHHNKVVTGAKTQPYGFGSDNTCLRNAFQANDNEVWAQTQFWVFCFQENGRSWEQWRSERNQDGGSVLKNFIPSTITMVKWGYDILGLDSSVVG